MWKTASSLKADVARWRGQGWVTADGEAAIRSEIDARAAMSVPAVFAILGAVLFAFAALSLVAANWQAMSKLARLALLLSAMLGAYAAAGALFARDRPAFAHAVTLLAAGLFGANIMLIAQMYHIHGHPPGAVFVWAVGALGAGLLIGSNPTLVLALALTCLWSSMESEEIARASWGRPVSLVHGAFLPAVAVLAAAFAWRGYRFGLELCAAAATVWVILLGYLLEGAPRHGEVALIGAIATGLALAAGRSGLARGPVAADVAAHAVLLGAVVVFAGLYAGQFQHGDDAPRFGVWAGGLLAVSAAAVWFGLREGRSGLVRLAYFVFSVEIVTVYIKTVGSLMGSAVFFLSAGLGMIALAMLVMRLERAARAVPPSTEATP